MSISTFPNAHTLRSILRDAVCFYVQMMIIITVIINILDNLNVPLDIIYMCSYILCYNVAADARDVFYFLHPCHCHCHRNFEMIYYSLKVFKSI